MGREGLRYQAYEGFFRLRRRRGLAMQDSKAAPKTRSSAADASDRKMVRDSPHGLPDVAGKRN